MQDQKPSYMDELHADFQALDHVERIINRSTFHGNAAVKIANSLELLALLKQGVMTNLHKETEKTSDEV